MAAASWRPTDRPLLAIVTKEDRLIGDIELCISAGGDVNVSSIRIGEEEIAIGVMGQMP